MIAMGAILLFNSALISLSAQEANQTLPRWQHNLTLRLQPADEILNPGALPWGYTEGLTYFTGKPESGGYLPQGITLNGSSLGVSLVEEKKGLWTPGIALAGRMDSAGLGLGVVFPGWGVTRSRVSASFISRPLAGFSLGAAGIVGPEYQWQSRFSGALRPLGFLEATLPYENILALGADISYSPKKGWHDSLVGLELKPWEPLTLALRWADGNPLPQAELSLAWNYMSLGSRLKGDTMNNLSADTLGVSAFININGREINKPQIVNQIIEYPLAGQILETAVPSDDWEWLTGDGIPRKSLLEVLRDIEVLTRDPLVKGLYLKNPIFFSSLAARMEIAEALNQFREAGKTVTVYFTSAENNSYLFAAACADTIIMAPPGYLGFQGLSLSRTYFGTFLEKWGITFHVFRTSPYKNGPDELAQGEMSAEERENLQVYLDDIYGSLLGEAETNRPLNGELTWHELSSRGPWFNLDEAREAGLVDHLLYEEEAEDFLAEEYGLALGEYQHRRESTYDRWKPEGKAEAAMLRLAGSIHSGSGTGESIAADDVIETLRQIRNDGSIKALLLRIDSGGGSVLASDLITHELQLLKDKGISIVVLMGGAAASGGYYIATPADWIIASPYTLTGSIGVYTFLPGLTKLMEEQQIGWAGVSTSPSALFGNPFKELSPQEKEKLQGSIDRSYQNFLTLVQESRELSDEELQTAAGARIWTGELALDLGLVDQLGGYNEAFAKLKEILGIPRPKVVDVTPWNRDLSLSGLINQAVMNQVNKALAGFSFFQLNQLKMPDAPESGALWSYCPYQAP